MRRRIVSSVHETLAPPLGQEALKTLASEGMRQAASFAAQFSIFAQFPAIRFFSSGTPNENGMLFCDTPFRTELLETVLHSSIITVGLGMATCPACDGEDKITALCELVFKRGGRPIRTIELYFERTTGLCVCTAKSVGGPIWQRK